MNFQLATSLQLLLCTAALLSACGLSSDEQNIDDEGSFQVLSFNIRYNNPDDGEHAWPNRKNRVAALIRFHETDLLGVQEALRGQIDDLDQQLPNHDWVGVGRTDGGDEGEFSAIFYRTNRFELLDHDTFWLSPTPDVAGSQGWDAALPRIATWGEFRDKATGQRFYHFNTHFDHRGDTARLNSAGLLTDRISSIADTTAALITGDFNLTDDSKPYELLTNTLEDTRHTSITPAYGPESTYYGFELDEEPGPRIDYIFSTNDVTILRHGTLTDNRAGNYPSDHLPVLVEALVGVPAK